MENAREDAFEAQCHIILPHGINYVKAFANLPQHQTTKATHGPLTCTQTIRQLANNQNETKISCDIGNPMISGSSVIIF